MVYMKKGFTLVELLIVVVVLVTLMSMVFRLGNIGGESEKRAITIDRMQRLENALSGYYAAFGMYPPVPLHGSRDIFLTVKNGAQNDNGDENQNIWGWISADGMSIQNRNAEYQAWQQVHAACVSQPVGCEFPFDNSWADAVRAASEELQSRVNSSNYATNEQKQELANGFDDGVSSNINRHDLDEADWNKTSLFKHGALSFLLPRYLVMMNGDPDNNDLKNFYNQCVQWTDNNNKQSDSWTGDKMSWEKMFQYVNSDDNSDVMRVANISSQAVCARWMANFEKTLSTNGSKKLFGVEVSAGDNFGTIPTWIDDDDNKIGYVQGHIYTPGGYQGNANRYILDCITIRDGWNNDFYYYSPAPYQSYVVWSAGPNGRTFPPWVSREKLPANANKCISFWTKDDIVGQSN